MSHDPIPARVSRRAFAGMTTLAAAAAATPVLAKVRRVGGETILGEGAQIST